VRAECWRDIPAEQWNDWRWQLKNLVRTPEAFAGLLGLSGVETGAIRLLQARFRFAVSPYYFSLIDPRDPADPIRRMIVPSSLEQSGDGEIDPLGETTQRAAPGLIHRYPDRVLFLVTSFCSSYCRFCVRKRNWTDSDAASSTEEIEEAIAYIRGHEEIRDVLVSGGDPLTLPADRLDYILGRIRSIPHVQFLRIGSREPVMLPMRIDDGLLRVLDRHGPVWINTHFNHPREVTPESAAACEKLARLGIPLNNQSVLLAGVNDNLATMKELVHQLLRIRVRPYYLYHADPVAGASHLRTPLSKGVELLEGLRGHTTGLAVPTFVVDSPGGHGKIPLAPDYVVRAGPSEMVLRNYQGDLVQLTGPIV
jgi:lysine 2,3-aminomutase